MNQSQKAYIHSLLHKNRFAVLSTVNEDNSPHAAIIYYTVDEDFNFSFITAEETAKIHNIQNNHKVSLMIIQEETLETVQIYGTAKKSPSTLDETLTKLALKVNTDEIITSLPLLKHKGDKTVITIKPKAIYYRKYSNKKLDETVLNF